jgi:hypothetical protein
VDTFPGDGDALDENTHTSLGAAIMEGNALTGSHTINFSSTVFESGLHQISLLGSKLLLTANFTINGPTGATVTLVPVYGVGQEYRILEVDTNSTSTIKRLNLADAILPNGHGGGILNKGVLALEYVTITDCLANAGGGIANLGELWLMNSILANNRATSEGGAISTAPTNASKTHMEFSTLDGNRAGGGIVAGKGGAISVLLGAILTVNGGAIVGNESTGIGGGIYSSGGVLDLRDCALSQNSAEYGGGLYTAGGTADLILQRS